MAANFPYTHYACTCSDLTTSAPPTLSAKRASIAPAADIDSPEDSTFNPHDPRANYTLSPLDRLLFCDECTSIRCQRCYAEEVVQWYCPNCLFEVPSSAVKSDGNRCSRNCYNCPICTAIMAVTAMPQKSSEDAYILQCQYCDWSSLDIGVQLSKPTKVTEQLAKLRKSRVSAEPAAKGAQLSHEDAFANLTAFYKEQLNETGDPQNPYSGSPYSSPANLARIMSLYGGLSVNALKKTREKPQPMREARDEKEGAATYQLADKKAEDDLLRNIRALSWDDTTTSDQRLSAPLNYDARHVDELWPVATPLRTRKGKRCQTCRQILAYPESTKVNNLRYKIRLLAQNHLPRLSLRPLQAAVPPPNPSFRLRADDALQQPDLQPHVTQQYVLTIRNPIFETINVTLATPTVTPGRVASRVTMLCPSFTVGPAGDLWDEALGSSTSSAKGDGGRQAAMASLTGRDEPLDRQPEAGKVWQRTRNSTSVVLEIVPGSLKPAPSIVPTSEQEEELQDGDEVLEVPVYVRAEWEVNADDVDTPAHVLRDSTKEKKTGAGGEKVKKELAFWCVLGVGRIGGGG